ncbi:MAG: Cna B-type domain-containing protein [Anaerolineaceae bacterium]|nr:Cna B-type domain-containing protein [Anaerolineaceae bacterium]
MRGRKILHILLFFLLIFSLAAYSVVYADGETGTENTGSDTGEETGGETEENQTREDFSRYNAVYSNGDDGTLIITNSYTPERIDVTGGINWIDESNRDGVRPSEVTIQLFNGDDPISDQIVVLTPDNTTDGDTDQWNYTFEQVYKYQNQGELIDYTVRVTTPDDENYDYEFDKDIDKYFSTGTHAISLIVSSGDILFDDDDNRDGIRPLEITVQLYQNGEPYGDPITVTGEEWEYIFEDLPEFTSGEIRVPAVYSVDLADPVDEYTADFDETTRALTLQHSPALRNINISKVWDDRGDQDGIRPDSICVILHGDTNDYMYTLSDADSSDDNTWAYTFQDVHVNRDGAPIAYSLTEAVECPQPPENFTTQEDCEAESYVWHEAACSDETIDTEEACTEAEATWTAAACMAE